MWTAGCAGFAICYAALIAMEHARRSPALRHGDVPGHPRICADVCDGADRAEIFEGPRFGSIFGTLTIALLVGGAAGPWVTGDVHDVTGSYRPAFVDADDPTVGTLSLYVVDPFDGRIDLANPPLEDKPALAGFSIADGRLAWAAPAGNSGKTNHVKILAWTNEGFGQVESVAGDFLLVR